MASGGASGKVAGDVWRFIGRQLRGGPSLMIIPYLGFGNATMFSVRGRVLDKLTEQVSATGAQLLLTADSVAAATHAAAEGLIRTDALASVRLD